MVAYPKTKPASATKHVGTAAKRQARTKNNNSPIQNRKYPCASKESKCFTCFYDITFNAETKK
jgi:hypothetical protein